MRTTSRKIKLSLTRFSKNLVYITVEYLKMTARSKSNSSGAELGHLVKVSKIPFPYIYHCRISENDCEKHEQQFWSRIRPSGESF